MIQREWQTVKVNTYTGNADTYGQIRQDTPTQTDVEMVVKIYSQTNVSDPRYVDVELIGLTKDKWITDANTITINSQLYIIKRIIPSGKYNQILMQKVV